MVSDNLGSMSYTKNINDFINDSTINQSKIIDLDTTFAPISHTHTKSEITDFSHTHTKSEITDFSHTHSYS